MHVVCSAHTPEYKTEGDQDDREAEEPESLFRLIDAVVAASEPQDYVVCDATTPKRANGRKYTKFFRWQLVLIRNGGGLTRG